MEKSFDRNTVIITGASQGVGAATARAFAKRGANLVLIARGQEKLDALADALEAIDGIANIALVPKTGPQLHRAA